MTRGLPAATCLAILVATVVGGTAHAGQHRINVASNLFSVANQAANNGDHIVWVWTGTPHSVTSGSGGTPSGIFDSAIQFSVASAFTWKADRTGVIPYYCIPHAPGMAAQLSLSASGAAAPSFRITEVFFNSPAGQDFIEITNLGTAAGNLGRYRVSIATGAQFTLPGVGTSLNIAVPIGGRVVLRLGQSGTDSNTEAFLPGQPQLGTTGSVALYAPNTINTSLAAADQIVDFVQWGATGQPNAATAVSANLWNGAEAAGTTAAPNAIEFCGDESAHGASLWRTRQGSSPGTADCTTPTFPSTWGRIKSAYR